MRTVHRYRQRKLRNIVTIGLVFVAMTLSIGYASKRAGAFTCEPVEHTVQYGDTLWRIAETYCDGSIQHATDKLVNAYGTLIQSGDRIFLPTNQDCEIIVIQKGQVYVYENC